VADAAVIGVPDALKGEVVKAFVVLAADVSGSEALARELREYVKTRLSAHEYPRVVEFVEMLPRTPSGKIQRYLLRDR
jgi:acetyl-CoA synthetase